MESFFVTATDTNVGKTVVSTLLALRYAAYYWKPIQAGSLENTDSHFLEKYIGKEKIVRESYRLQAAMSPNQAAEREGISIDLANIIVPKLDASLVVEGAGGICVPINDRELVRDIICHCAFPVILVARSTLGTLNHTLLSLASLREKSIPIKAVLLIGPPHMENKRTLREWGKVDVLELPWIEDWSLASLQKIAWDLF